MSAEVTTIIAATALLMTVLGMMWSSINRRIDDLRDEMNKRFEAQEKLLDAKLDLIRADIRELKEAIARPPLVRP